MFILLLVFVVVFFLNQRFLLFFSTVKMTANYAEIGMVVTLKTGFQQVPLVQIF